MKTTQKIDRKKLIKAAIASLKTCYPPKPRLSYGAAVLTTAGKIYSGSNYSSDTASLLLHAEQMALAHAAMHNDTKILAIAIVGKGKVHLSVSDMDVHEDKEFAHPCGLCKQLIWESSLRSGIDTEVIMANLKGGYVTEHIKKMVPYPWPNPKTR
jgi:cytidine deaminase